MPNGDCHVGSANAAKIEAAQISLETALREIREERDARDRVARELAAKLNAETAALRQADKELREELRRVCRILDNITDWKKLLAALLAFLIASGAGSAIATILTDGGIP